MGGPLPKTDPVCGQTVDPLRARGIAIYDGERYYFCCAEHRERFVAEPEKYAPRAEAAPEPALHDHEDPPPPPAPEPPPPETKAAGGTETQPAPAPAPEAAAEAGAMPAAEPPPARPTLRFEIGGMTSAEDAERVRRAIEKVPGVGAIAIDLLTEVAAVGVDSDAFDRARIIEAVSTAGYEATPRKPPRPVDPEALAARVAEARRHALFGLALAAIAVALGLAGARGVLAVVELAGVAALLAFPARAFVAGALRRRSSFDLLALLAAGAALAFATVALARHGASAPYADSAAAILAFALVGRWIEETARRGSGAAMLELEQAQPTRARRVRAGAPSELVPVSELVAGDMVRAGTGDPMPVDGVVRIGDATVDESLVSGDSTPVARSPGDAVVAGTVVISGTIVVEVRRTGEDTVLARIRAAVAEAQHSRAPLSRLADRAAGWVLPAALALAAGALALHVFAGGKSLGAALPFAVAVLAASFSPALALATPTAMAIATSRAARRGILFRNAEAMERAWHVRTVAVNKTGTLTVGRPKVEAHAALPGADENRLLALAASAERAVDSPLSRAIRAYVEGRGLTAPPPDRATSVPGMGAGATVAGVVVSVGSRRFLERESVPVPDDDLATLRERLGGGGRSVIYVAIGGKLAGGLSVNDPVRGEAQRFVSRLRAAGMKVVLYTGDGADAADAAASEAGIDDTRADLRPDEKKAVVVSLSRHGAAVAAVGDGIADAPALAAADVGVALGGGAELALEAGSVTVLTGNLTSVAEALDLARGAVGVMRQNVAWAVAYNIAAALVVAAVPLGAHAPTWVAAATAGSTFVVAANSLRLRRRGR